MTPNKTMRARDGVPDLLDFRLCVKNGKLALDENYAARVRVATRDAWLSAVDPNDKPGKNAISGIGDPGVVWTGIERDLNSLPAAVRDEVGKLFMSYALGQGWKLDASGTSITTGDARGDIDWAQQGRAAADEIRRCNDANRAFWGNASGRSHTTATADSRAVDRRREAEDGVDLAGATRDLVSSINKGNAEFWANIEASRTRR